MHMVAKERREARTLLSAPGRDNGQHVGINPVETVSWETQSRWHGPICKSLASRISLDCKERNLITGICGTQQRWKETWSEIESA